MSLAAATAVSFWKRKPSAVTCIAPAAAHHNLVNPGVQEVITRSSSCASWGTYVCRHGIKTTDALITIRGLGEGVHYLHEASKCKQCCVHGIVKASDLHCKQCESTAEEYGWEVGGCDCTCCFMRMQN